MSAEAVLSRLRKNSCPQVRGLGPNVRPKHSALRYDFPRVTESNFWWVLRPKAFNNFWWKCSFGPPAKSLIFLAEHPVLLHTCAILYLWHSWVSNKRYLLKRSLIEFRQTILVEINYNFGTFIRFLIVLDFTFLFVVFLYITFPLSNYNVSYFYMYVLIPY